MAENIASEVLREIMKRKGITAKEISTRRGYAPSNAGLLLKKDNKTTTLAALCDAIGVELCILDGWKKYRLNSFADIPEVEMMFSEMHKRVGDCNEDRYLTDKEERREKDKRINGRLGVRRCERCIHSEPRLRKEDRIFCTRYRRYAHSMSCHKFEERNEGDIQETAEKADVE